MLNHYIFNIVYFGLHIFLTFDVIIIRVWEYLQ